jgi:two-component system, NarL family, nitrate/nitrite response regulator NarL
MPLADRSPSFADRPAAETQADSPINVILVSELLLIRAALRELLKGCGLHVIEASSCEEALHVAPQHLPNVIVVDLGSRSDTLACLEDLVADDGRRIIALSERGHEADHPTLIERGATGIVLKNEPPEVFIKAITKVHAGEVWIDRTITATVLNGIARRRHAEATESEKITRLTPREREIISLVGEGLKNAAIAQKLFISEATARNHLTSILDKLNLTSRFELAVYAFRFGLVKYSHPKSETNSKP